jgi:hypothetical protein
MSKMEKLKELQAKIWTLEKGEGVPDKGERVALDWLCE